MYLLPQGVAKGKATVRAFLNAAGADLFFKNALRQQCADAHIWKIYGITDA